VTGILAAAGPGLELADVPAGAEIVQLPATILRLHGVSADGLDGAPLEDLLSDTAPAAGVTAAPSHEASDEPVYTEEEERQMVEKLRDLGYE
jgi:hypothetical protein